MQILSILLFLACVAESLSSPFRIGPAHQSFEGYEARHISRRLAYFPVGTATAGSNNAILLAPGLNKFETVGNVTVQLSQSGVFTSVYAYGPSNNASIPRGAWQASIDTYRAECVQATLNSSQNVDVYLFTVNAFLTWRAALARNSTVDPGIIQVPNVAEGSVFHNVTKQNFTVSTDPQQSYLLTIFNNNNSTTNVTYQVTAFNSSAAVCQEFASDFSAAPAIALSPGVESTEITATTSIYDYLVPSSTALISAVTNASCAAFGLAYREGTDDAGLPSPNVADIFSVAPTPVPSLQELNMSLFLVDEKGHQAYGSSLFVDFQQYAIGSYCTITAGALGPCFAYVDGLDPSKIYYLWIYQAPISAFSAQMVRFWDYSVLTAEPSGSCSQLFSYANSTQRTTPAPAPAPPPATTVSVAAAGSTSGSSNTGAIVGGVVGGVVGCAAVALLIFFLARRRSRARRQPDVNLFSDTKTNTGFYDTEDFQGFDKVVKGKDSDLPNLKGVSSLGTSSNPGSSLLSPLTSAGSQGLASDKDFQAVDEKFGLKAVKLPEPSMLPSNEGILSIVDQGGESRGEEIDFSDLDNTWKISSSELKCKVENGKPVLLGQGGFGSVYLGLMNDVRKVAIKVVDSHSEKQQQRFVREILTLKACLDPNIVQFLGACVQNQQTLMVMQYMSGGDLYNRIRDDKERTFHWHRKGRSIALDVAKGLVYLHSKKIAHLDLKTPNILLTSQLEAKISDVGLGKLVAGTSVATQQGSFMWAAPEQLTGDECSTASDIYSFGVIMWELCSLEAPARRRMRALNVPTEAPQAIVDLIARCHKSPEERPTAVEAHNIILRTT